MRGRRRCWGAVAAVVRLALVAGCAAGPPSEYLRPQGDGVTGRVGDLVVTNALLDGGETGEVPPGGTAVVRATIVNEGDVPDRLLAVASRIVPARANVRSTG